MAPLKKLALVALLSLSAGLQPAIAAHNNPEDVAAVREVVEAFRLSIINKDKATFMGLFYSDNPERVTWQTMPGLPGSRSSYLKRVGWFGGQRTTT